MSEPGYPEPVCKGEWRLGTACGKCERCKLLLPGWLETRAEHIRHAEIIEAVKSVEKRLETLLSFKSPPFGDETDISSPRGRAAAVLRRATEKGVELRPYAGQIGILLLLDEIAAEIAK